MLKCLMPANRGHGSPHTFLFSAGLLQVLLTLSDGEGTLLFTTLSFPG